MPLKSFFLLFAGLTLLSSNTLAQTVFEGRLILEDVASEHLDDGPYDPGHTEFKVLSDYSYIDAAGRKWTVPVGTVVNGASIPKVAWSIMGGPWSGEHRNAAVIHDYLCEQQIEDSDTVHRLFYEGLIAGGVGTAKANIMYFAVLKGGPHWEKGAGLAGLSRGELSEDELKKFRERTDLEELSPGEIQAIVDKGE